MFRGGSKFDLGVVSKVPPYHPKMLCVEALMMMEDRPGMRWCWESLVTL